MNSENPYAPPAASETETVLVCSGDGWKLLGHILLVRRGATLPMVDLESGRSSPTLRPYRQPYALFRSTHSFWSHADPHRTFLYRLRYFIREVTFWPVYLLVLFAPDGIFPSFLSKSSSYPWLFAIFALYAVWGFMDRPKLIIEDSIKPGWLRVTPIHPDALDYLRDLAGKSRPPLRIHRP